MNNENNKCICRYLETYNNYVNNKLIEKPYFYYLDIKDINFIHLKQLKDLIPGLKDFNSSIYNIPYIIENNESLWTIKLRSLLFSIISNYYYFIKRNHRINNIIDPDNNKLCIWTIDIICNILIPFLSKRNTIIEDLNFNAIKNNICDNEFIELFNIKNDIYYESSKNLYFNSFYIYNQEELFENNLYISRIILNFIKNNNFIKLLYFMDIDKNKLIYFLIQSLYNMNIEE